MTRLRPRLPGWTRHPGFGVAVLLVLAIGLIVHGEPQPSSRPSGTSVGVSGTARAPATVPAILVISDGVVSRRQQHTVHPVPLPARARPLAVVTGRGLSVVLAALDGRQHALAVGKDLHVRDLGLADAVIPAASGSAAVIVETALTEPGLLVPTVSASPSRTNRSTSAPTSSGAGSATGGSPTSGPPALRNFAVRSYDSAGRPAGNVRYLPEGTRMATDTSVGLIVWQPVNRVFDNGAVLEPLSAAATLIRPDNTLRQLGPVHPLAANAKDLLVWDVVGRRFGVMPLHYVTSTATSTASPSKSRTAPAKSGSPSPTPTPTTVAGVRWFLPTRGISVITGPASFDPDGSAFAVYAQVGSRRRLVVAKLDNAGTNQVEVLALVQPQAGSSAAASASGSGPVPPAPSEPLSTSGSGSASDSALNSESASNSGSASKSAGKSPSASTLALQPDGFPIPAPLTPLWWSGKVVALGADSTVVSYRPGSDQASLLDLGVKDLQAIAPTP